MNKVRDFGFAAYLWVKHLDINEQQESGLTKPQLKTHYENYKKSEFFEYNQHLKKLAKSHQGRT